MDVRTTSQPNQNNGRRALVVTFVIFVFPVVVAFTLLKTGWYTAAGTTNHGTLINPPIPFDDLTLVGEKQSPLPAEQFRKKWWMMYVMPRECDSACKNSLYLMRQTRQALGPEQNRVAELIVISHPLSAELATWLATEFSHATIVSAPAGNLDQTLQQALSGDIQPSEAGHIFLVDTMGAIFMHYPSYEDERESILKGRDLLKDLQKVLKLSKIG